MNKLHIVLISHFFPPEEPPAAFLAFELAQTLEKAGHNVSVVTSFPNWPTGKVHYGFSNSRVTTETQGNLNIIRLPFLASPNGGFFKRALDFASFRLMVNKEGRKLLKPDLIYVLVPPNEDGLAARSLAKYFKCPYIVNIQDIHPDTAINLGFIKNKILIKLLKHQESRMYKDAAHVVAIGHQMKKTLINKGVYEKKISVIPNWIDTNTIYPMKKGNNLHREWKIPENTFIILYAGTFGRIHGTSILIEVASAFQNKNILFLLVGQGQGFNEIKEKINKNKFPNILLKSFVSRNRLSELQALADISIVLTKKGFGLTSVPSKVLGYMAAARAILAAVDKNSDTANLIKNANSGIIVPPESVQGIIEAIDYAYQNPHLVKNWGNNARNHVINQLSSSVILPNAVRLLENIAMRV